MVCVAPVWCTDVIVWCWNFLQLDLDGGSPPEQAWRRRLNSHANILKEFSVTFMEAMKMVCCKDWFP